MISKRISYGIPSTQVEERIEPPASIITKLFVRRQDAIVTIEPNQVIRGSLFGCEEKDLCRKAEEVFEKFVIAKTLSFAELYGSKICAALDRQHPRDIFDIMLLMKNEGITDQVRRAFLIYLIWGGLTIMLAEADKTKLDEGTQKIRNALFGLAILVLSYAIVLFVEKVFQINLLKPEFPS